MRKVTTDSNNIITGVHYNNIQIDDQFPIVTTLTDTDIIDNYTYINGVIAPRSLLSQHLLNRERSNKLQELKRYYLGLCEGIDLKSRKRIYVDCVVDTFTYRMDAGRKPAETHDAAIRLAESNKETSTVIVDFNNTIHQNVPINRAKEVALQQAINARSIYMEYQVKKASIINATSIQYIQTFSISFNINTL